MSTTSCMKTDQIGFIEAQMNGIIFKPPNRNYLRRDGFVRPHYIETLESVETFQNSSEEESERIVISYFVLHPNEISHARQSQKLQKKKESNPPYILWSHGNGSDLMESYSTMEALHSELGGHIGIIMYDYEGYGFSSGHCRETNCYRDLELMVKFCLNDLKIPTDRLFLLGQSLGTGVVIDYISKNNEWNTPIILLSPYKTISRVVIDPHWTDLFTSLIVNSLDRFTSIDKIGNINCPIIIYHGMKDTMIPYKHSVELRKANKRKTTLILLKRAGHNDILSHIDSKEIWNIVFNHINKNE